MEFGCNRNLKLQKIWEKIDHNVLLSREDALELLNIDSHSTEFYELLAKANELSRREYENRGYIFVQIGINSAPCSGNCKFCSMSADSYMLDVEMEASKEEVIEQVKKAVEEKVDALFLMTTADYSLDKFADMASAVKEYLPEDMMFIANTGDFDEEGAKKLKKAGFTGAYHIVRLGEGEDTDLPVKNRLQTLNAIKAVGLDLIYCVEPIGPEHTYEQIADEMLRAREYGVDVMACMKRVCVPGTPLGLKGEITDLELTKIAAVARLVTRPKQSMNVHEPKELALLAGVNQLYAEIGINPRDCNAETQNSRGYSIEQAKNMLRQADYVTIG